MADVFAAVFLTLHVILGYENCSVMFLSKWVFQFSLFDKRTIQAYGVLQVLHHPAPGWNCVTATTNTNRNPETNPNIHPPCYNIPPYLPMIPYLPTSLWLLLAVWGGT